MKEQSKAIDFETPKEIKSKILDLIKSIDFFLVSNPEKDNQQLSIVPL